MLHIRFHLKAMYETSPVFRRLRQQNNNRPNFPASQGLCGISHNFVNYVKLLCKQYYVNLCKPGRFPPALSKSGKRSLRMALHMGALSPAAGCRKKAAIFGVLRIFVHFMNRALRPPPRRRHPGLTAPGAGHALPGAFFCHYVSSYRRRRAFSRRTGPLPADRCIS